MLTEINGKQVYLYSYNLRLKAHDQKTPKLAEDFFKAGLKPIDQEHGKKVALLRASKVIMKQLRDRGNSPNLEQTILQIAETLEHIDLIKAFSFLDKVFSESFSRGTERATHISLLVTNHKSLINLTINDNFLYLQNAKKDIRLVTKLDQEFSRQQLILQINTVAEQFFRIIELNNKAGEIEQLSQSSREKEHKLIFEHMKSVFYLFPLSLLRVFASSLDMDRYVLLPVETVIVSFIAWYLYQYLKSCWHARGITQKYRRDLQQVFADFFAESIDHLKHSQSLSAAYAQIRNLKSGGSNKIIFKKEGATYAIDMAHIDNKPVVNLISDLKEVFILPKSVMATAIGPKPISEYGLYTMDYIEHELTAMDLLQLFGVLSFKKLEARLTRSRQVAQIFEEGEVKLAKTDIDPAIKNNSKSYDECFDARLILQEKYSRLGEAIRSCSSTEKLKKYLDKVGVAQQWIIINLGNCDPLYLSFQRLTLNAQKRLADLQKTSRQLDQRAAGQAKPREVPRSQAKPMLKPFKLAEVEKKITAPDLKEDFFMCFSYELLTELSKDKYSNYMEDLIKRLQGENEIRIISQKEKKEHQAIGLRQLTKKYQKKSLGYNPKVNVYKFVIPSADIRLVGPVVRGEKDNRLILILDQIRTHKSKVQ